MPTLKEIIEKIISRRINMGLSYSKLSEDDFIEFTRDMLMQIKLVSYKYKK